MDDDCCRTTPADAYRFEQDETFGKIYRCPKCDTWYHWGDLPCQVDPVVEVDQAACSRCGGPHRFDTVVPNDDWNAVIRGGGPEHGDEHLCLACIVEAFTVAGRQLLLAHLVGGPFADGVDWTIVLVRS